VEPEKADDDVTWSHATYGVERVLDVGWSKQTQNELYSVLHVAEAQLDHIHETAESNNTH